jgi:hypothetical protein
MKSYLPVTAANGVVACVDAADLFCGLTIKATANAMNNAASSQGKFRIAHLSLASDLTQGKNRML